MAFLFCILSRLLLSFYFSFSQRSGVFLFFRVLSRDHVFPTLLFHPIFYSSFVTFIHRKWFSNFFILHLFLLPFFFQNSNLLQTDGSMGTYSVVGGVKYCRFRQKKSKTLTILSPKAIRSQTIRFEISFETFFESDRRWRWVKKRSLSTSRNQYLICQNLVTSSRIPDDVEWPSIQAKIRGIINSSWNLWKIFTSTSRH